MKILIPSPLRSYTGASEIEAEGDTLGALIDNIDQRFAGFAFRLIDEQGRVRPHMRVFVGNEQVFDLARPLQPGDSIAIVQALSGG